MYCWVSNSFRRFNFFSLFKKILDGFVFSSLYIAMCAVAMVHLTWQLFAGGFADPLFYGFVFFSTIASYNTHWFLTPFSLHPSARIQWANHRKSLHLLFSIIGIAGAGICFLFLLRYWLALSVGVFLTFLYTAPKIPLPVFRNLKKIAVGKTVFLAMVWTFVTTVLPIVVASLKWQGAFSFFSCSQFFLIYAICILFDLRDRDDDKAEGIRSLITYFSIDTIRVLYKLSILLFFLFSLLLFFSDFSLARVLVLILPGIICWFLYDFATRNYSDYLYYVLLDGLMMLSALLMLIPGI